MKYRPREGSPLQYLALVLLMVAAAGVAQARDRPLSGEGLLLARIDLELRRPGGPDADAVARLLEGGFRPTREWLVRAARACAEGAASCAAFLPIAADRLATSDGFLADELEALRTIELLAALEQHLGWERQQAFERMLRGHLAAVSASGGQARRIAFAHALRCAQRALEEGFVELVPLIRESGLSAYVSIAEAERYAAALDEADPVAALLGLIDEAAAADTTRPRLRPSPRPPTAGLLAVAELRRRNPSGVLVGLRDSLDRYNCSLSPHENSGPAPQGTLQLFTIDFGELNPIEDDGDDRLLRVCLGELGVALAELIGDLGDRMVERETLGALTLADRVEDGLRREQELALRQQREEGEGCEAGLDLPVEVMRTLDAMFALRLGIDWYAVDNNVYPTARSIAGRSASMVERSAAPT